MKTSRICHGQHRQVFDRHGCSTVTGFTNLLKTKCFYSNRELFTLSLFVIVRVKPRPNDGNISTQHIPTLLAQLLQAPAKRSQHWKATGSTDHNIVGRNTLHAFGHPVATCCGTLGVENRTSAHAQVQHCCTKLAKRLQHHAASTNVAWKIWPFSYLSQHHPTCRNMSQQGGQTHTTCCTQQCCDMLSWNVAIVWPGLNQTTATSQRNISQQCCPSICRDFPQAKLDREINARWPICFYFIISIRTVSSITDKKSRNLQLLFWQMK